MSEEFSSHVISFAPASGIEADALTKAIKTRLACVTSWTPPNSQRDHCRVIVINHDSITDARVDELVREACQSCDIDFSQLHIGHKLLEEMPVAWS